MDLEKPLIQEEDEVYSPQSTGYTNAGILSKVTFQWMNPLFRRDNQSQKLLHVRSVSPFERAETASTLLQESLRHSSSVPIAIMRTVWIPLAITAVFAGVNVIASYTGPFLITHFMNYMLRKHDGSAMYDGLKLAVIFFIAMTLESVTQRQLCFGARRIGLHVRAALTALIYQKSISLSGKSCSASNGNIVNLISVDVEAIGEFFSSIHGVWLIPFQVLLALVILYRSIGAAPCLAALLTTALVVVGNTPLAKVQQKNQSKIMQVKDSRMKTTSETLKNMRVVKFNSWETRFSECVFKLRQTELCWLKKFMYTKAALVFLFWTSPTIVSLAAFGVCFLVKTPLGPSTVLPALVTFRILTEPIYNLPELISAIIKTKVSIDRIQEFMRSEDIVQHLGNVPSVRSSILSDKVMIEIGRAEYAWKASDQYSKGPTIKIKETLKITKGDKVAVCGSVGSGKSSLLGSVLGEIPMISGVRSKVYGTIAYVPQSPWIQTGTIRKNILFGKDLNSDYYDEVLKFCALEQDIRIWGNGDLTLVGERGVNLSGGQKQRIQLARAIYSDSDVYILDDPFSAVDAHTGTHLFKKCLLQYLSKKTVIYATHQLEFLEAADFVLVIRDGQIAQSGTYKELIADTNGELVSQMAEHMKSLQQVRTCPHDSSDNSTSSPNTTEALGVEKVGETSTNGKIAEKKCQQEEAHTGRVKWTVYSTFATHAYGGALIPIVLLCQVLFQVLEMARNYWMAWAADTENMVSRQQTMLVFTLLSGGSSLFILGRAVITSAVALETSQRLFHGMTSSVFRAPMAFFDSTPSSRILNSSSSDQSIVDMDVPFRLAGLVFALIQLICSVVLMSMVAWQVFLLFLVVFALSVWYMVYYITTARELARMVAVQKALILHHFSESITGAATIRCFNQEDRFLEKIRNVIDDFSGLAFHNYATMEWLSVRINFLFNFAFFVVLSVLVSLPKSAIDPSLAGLAASYGLNLSVLQAWVIWNLCNVENSMISVERILQFTRIPSEAPLVIKDARPKPEWPTHGQIELQNLHVQYKPTLPMVIKGVTCNFPGKKKIGVVGRTGSGKSTLIQALFRVVEPSSGKILIDGLDICTIGLQDLRSSLGIIPQDPTLFQGTVRTNLDPLKQHSCSEIWEVLDKCQLSDIVKQNQRLLDAPVAEDGENWSVGQRQLVCLARVLLKKRRILVLDEATASIDAATDNVIQQIIREAMKDCTVISVAHRIPTVIDNDLVLVLDEGKIVEYDSPDRLLKDSSSMFSMLVAEFLRRSSRTES